MTTKVIIPFFGSDPQRTQNLAHTRKWYEKHEFEVIVSAGNSIGEARNNGALLAIDSGATHLFFCDSDIIVDPTSIDLAVAMTELTGSAVYPYGRMVRMGSMETQFFMSGKQLPTRTDGVPEAGALVIGAQEFISVCGYPQISWGEDNIFHNVCQALLGPITRVWEPAYHLYHQPSSGYFDTRMMQVMNATEQFKADPARVRAIMSKAGCYDFAKFTARGYKQAAEGLSYRGQRLHWK